MNKKEIIKKVSDWLDEHVSKFDGVDVDLSVEKGKIDETNTTRLDFKTRCTEE